jgi:hypothetical protein
VEHDDVAFLMRFDSDAAFAEVIASAVSMDHAMALATQYGFAITPDVLTRAATSRRDSGDGVPRPSMDGTHEHVRAEDFGEY